MERQAEGRDVRALKRIVLTLLALAALAERCFDAPGPVRRLVLWLLRTAEATASGFVHEVMGAPLWEPAPSLGKGDSAACALQLAERFRVLAGMLEGYCAIALQSRHDEPEWLTALDMPRFGSAGLDQPCFGSGLMCWAKPKLCDTS